LTTIRWLYHWAEVDEFMSNVPNAKPLIQTASMPTGKGAKAAKGVMSSRLGKPQAEPSTSGGSGSAMKMSSAELQSQFPTTLTAEQTKQSIEQAVPQAEMLGLDYEAIAEQSKGKSPIDIAFEQVSKIEDPKEKERATGEVYGMVGDYLSNEINQMKPDVDAYGQALAQQEQQIKAMQSEYERLAQQDPQSAQIMEGEINAAIQNHRQGVGEYNSLIEKYNAIGTDLNAIAALTPNAVTNNESPLSFEGKSFMERVGLMFDNPESQAYKGAWNTVVPSTISTLAGIFGASGVDGAPLTSFGRMSSNLSESLENLSNQAVIPSYGAAKEQLEVSVLDDLNPYNVNYLAGGVVSTIIGTMASGAFGGNGAAQLFNANLGFGGMYSWAREAGLTKQQSSLVAIPVAFVYGYLGDKGVEQLSSLVGKESFKKIIIEGVKDMGKSATPKKVGDLFVDAIKKEGKNILVGGGKEFVQEGVEFSSEFGTKVLASKVFDIKPEYEKELTADAFGKGLAENAVVGGVVGSALAPVIRNLPSRRKLSDLVAESSVNFQAKEKFLSDLNTLVASGKITNEQVESVVQDLERAEQANTKVPKNVTNVGARGEAIDLIQEKEELAQEVETIDPAMAKPMMDRIAEIDNTLAQISFFNEQSQQPEQSDWRSQSGLKSIAEIVQEQKDKKERGERIESGKQLFEQQKQKAETVRLQKESEVKQLIAEQRAQRDREVEELAKIRPDLTSDDMLLGELSDEFDVVLGRMDLNIPTDIVAIDGAIEELDNKFSEIKAYRDNPKRTHTDAQIDEVVSLLDAAKTELQYYKEAVIDDEKSISERKQVQGIPETKVGEATQKPKTAEQQITQTPQTNAEEQQSGALRNESEQVQAEGAVDSNMPVVNETELQDGQGSPELRTKEEDQAKDEVISKATGTKVEDIKGLKQVLKDVFGLNNMQSDSVSVVMDRMIGAMASRVLKTKAAIYETIGFKKDIEENILETDNALFQGTIDGKEVTLKNVNADVVNGFYSPLEKVINETKFDKLPAKQWLEKFAKGEEAKWTGLNEWISQQQGSVSKADIQQYLKENRIQVVEVVKGGEIIVEDKAKLAEIESQLNSMGFTLEADMGGGGSMLIDRDGEIADYDENQDAYRLLETYNELSDDNFNVNSRVGQPDTKFSQYQLEGEKSNYKEVLVTMPPKEIKGELYHIVRDKYLLPALLRIGLDRRSENALRRMKIYDEEGRSKEFESDSDFPIAIEALNKLKRAGEQEALNKYYDGFMVSSLIDDQRKNTFKSSHFDEPNILVHLRMNTRTDADGNKVLFLEEVQSDWGQSGKKEGFKEPSFEWDTQLGKDAVVVLKKMNETAGFSDWKGLATAMAKSNDILNDFQVPYDSKDLMLKWHKAVNQERKVPQAPFVMDTNAWTKLGLKVALKEAVKQGADKIAWTTGEQQNERYDLSKQVDKIEVEHITDYEDIFFVDIKLSNGTTENIEVENGIIREGSYRGQRLDNVIGKDYADKVLSTPKGESITLEGNDLKVGGKGMKGFYGSPTEGSLGIVGNVAKSLFKQEPKTVNIDANERGKSTKDFEGLKESLQFEKQLADKGKTGIVSTVNKDGSYTIEWNENKPSTQHSIDITPELKAQVQQGLALFQKQRNQKAKGAMVAADGNYIIYALTDPNVSTPLHELAHVYEHYLTDQERTDVLDWANTESWTTETSEKFAKGFEKYLSEGIAPDKSLEGIFKRFQKWLTDIYNGITGSEIDLALNDKMREIYSAMLGFEVANTPTQQAGSVGGDVEIRAEESQAQEVKVNAYKKYNLTTDSIYKKYQELSELYSGRSIEDALRELGVDNADFDAIKEQFYKDFISKELPSKLPIIKNRFGIDNLPQGEVNLKPITKPEKVVDAKTTREKSALLKDIVGDDDLRPVMTGVFNDSKNKKLVATNGISLISIKDTSIKEDAIISPKTGQKIDGKFPNYEAVIPKENPIKQRVSVSEILGIARAANRASQFFGKKDERGILVSFKIGDDTFLFSAKLMEDVFTVLAKLGKKNVTIEMSAPNRAAVINDGDITALIMPIMGNDESAFANVNIITRQKVKAEIENQQKAELAYIQSKVDDRKAKVDQARADVRNAKTSADLNSANFDLEYQTERYNEALKELSDKKSDINNLENPLQEQEDINVVTEAINNGEITEEQAANFIKDEQSNEIESIVKDIESKAESESEIDNQESIDNANDIIEQSSEQIDEAQTSQEVAADPFSAFNAIAEELGKEAERQVGQQVEEKTIDQKIQDEKNKLMDLFRNSGNIGFALDPEQEARRQFNIHRQIVTLAKLYIQKGIQSAQDFATEMGLRINDVKRAWDEAMGGKAITEDDLAKEPYDRQFIDQVFGQSQAQQLYSQAQQDAMDAIENGAVNFSAFDAAMASNPNYNSLSDSAKKDMYAEAVSNYSNEQAILQANQYNQQNAPLLKLRPQTRFERLRTLIQNSLTRLKDVQTQLEEQGIQIYDDINAAMKFELLIGKAKSKIEEKYREVVKSNNKNAPALLQRLNKEGGNADELGIYKYALHAKERNAANAQERQDEFDKEVAILNDKIDNATSPALKRRYEGQLKDLIAGKGKVRLMPDGGSGMTNQQADEIIDLVEQSGKKDLYDRYAQEFRDAVIIPNLQAKLDYGLINQETFDNVSNKYQFYVPLQVVEKAIKSKASGGFSAKSLKGKDIFKAKGSRFYNYTERYNPIMSAMFAYNETVMKGEENRAREALLRLAENDKNEDIFEITRPDYRPVVNSNGDVIPYDVTSPYVIKNSVDMKVDGKPVYVVIKDAALLKAMQGQGIQRGIRGLYLINHWLRMTATLANPEFIFTNFDKDYMGALFNVQSDRVQENAKGVTRFMANPKNIAKSGKAIIDDYKGNHKSEFAKYAKEYRESGGQVSWFQRETIDEFVKDVEKKIKAIEKGGRPDKKLLGLIGETMFLAQSTVEQSIRLNAYIAFRKQGVSPEKAASVAKNITVNFEAKGTIGGFVDSLFIFTNAMWQGSFRTGVALVKSKKARAIAASLVAIGFLESWINDILGGDDDDDEQINKSVRERNLVLLNPSKESSLSETRTYFKFPLSYGLNIFKMLGNVAYDVSNGRQDPLDGSKDILLAIYNQVSPFQGPTIAQALSPTVLDPFVQAAENRSFFGSAIKPEQSRFGGQDKKESELYFSSVRPESRKIAKWLSENTPKGSELAGGTIEISPEIIDHYYDAIAGGAGRFVANSLTTAANILDEEERASVKNVPFLRSFVGEITKKRNLDYAYNIYRTSSINKYSTEALKKFENDLNVAVRQESIDPKRRDEMIETVLDSQIKLDKTKEIITLRDEFAKKLGINPEQEGKKDMEKFTNLIAKYVVFRTKEKDGFYRQQPDKEKDKRNSLNRAFNEYKLGLMVEVATSYRTKGYQ
jgi:hypothetical protein